MKAWLIILGAAVLAAVVVALAVASEPDRPPPPTAYKVSVVNRCGSDATIRVHSGPGVQRSVRIPAGSHMLVATTGRPEQVVLHVKELSRWLDYTRRFDGRYDGKSLTYELQCGNFLDNLFLDNLLTIVSIPFPYPLSPARAIRDGSGR